MGSVLGLRSVLCVDVMLSMNCGPHIQPLNQAFWDKFSLFYMWCIIYEFLVKAQSIIWQFECVPSGR